MKTGQFLGRLSRPLSFRQQIVVLTACVTTFAMVLLAVVLQLVLASLATRSVDRVLAERAEAVISATASESHSADLAVPPGALDEGVAVYDGAGELIAGALPAAMAEKFAQLSRSERSTVAAVGELSRVRAEPFAVGDATGVVVLSEYLRPYETAEHLALIVTLVTGLVTVALASAVAAWATRRALTPVKQMAVTATEWSEHDLSRRFALGPPTNEISSLAQTLDNLLDKVSAAIRSEQRLTSELAHELRTPLTSIQGSAELMLLRDQESLSPQSREELAEISSACRRMGHTIATLLDVARAEATIVTAGTSRLDEVLAEVVEDSQKGEIGVGIDASDVRLTMPHALAVRTITPVVQNAVSYARSSVSISTNIQAGSVEVLVHDDGPGVPAELRELIFDPGTTSTAGGGSGLGLALARRLARAAGGDVTLAPDTDSGSLSQSGATFLVRLPVG